MARIQSCSAKTAIVPPDPGRGLPRWFNALAAAFGISVLAPLLALVWILVRIDSPGPPIFIQERIGLGGRPFRCFKFRTMSVAAPANSWLIEDFDTYLFNPAGLRDPRLTRCGVVLRRLSLDELPQLLNVIRGEMALVGPRPEIPEIVMQYPHEYHRRHLVPPGITGEAQVNGRADLGYAETMAYDLAYVARRSPRRDLDILWRTSFAIAATSGAR
jgi:lipopolysaccharide/colanic/teichoic acid biosynthesis glycosyltransferase